MQRPRDRSEGRSEDHISRAEAFQPDPQLQLSEGRASGLQIALIAFACMLVVGMMIYGLNQPTSDGNVTASAPAAQTTGTAPPAPQTGDNVAPKTEASPQDQPAQQPMPQQTKPGAVEDDSKR